MELTANILGLALQLLIGLTVLYFFFKKKIAGLKQSEANVEATVSENFVKLLEEHRKNSAESFHTLKAQYDDKIVLLQEEIIRLNKRISEVEDDYKSLQIIGNRRQEDLNKALEDKEYYRGKADKATELIEKHIKVA